MNDNANLSLLSQDHEEEGQGSQYLTFTLADENYGVSILRVQEIRGWEAATRVPNTAPHLKGVVNLRGNIVPVYDLRLWFGMPVADYTKETVVIIVRVGGEGENRSMGMVVDGVSDVLLVKDDQVGATPSFNAAVPTEYLQGLVSAGDDMVMLLDLDNLAAGTETATGEGAA
jgi:purine-binding chemotaxis protein CheW